jgi:hypothetical protein
MITLRSIGLHISITQQTQNTVCGAVSTTHKYNVHQHATRDYK